jgi:DNA-binding transcriptional LysR family regulator
MHNVFVMLLDPPSLLRWIHRRAANLDKATLGQLVTLLELVGAESVASMGKRSKTHAAVSAGVNYRQKLARLEQALGVGRLTRREGKFTRPTEAGIRVAGELRLFLEELRSIEGRKAQTATWVIGAGDAWLQSIIVPALTELSHARPEWRWQVRNMRSRDIRTELRDGILHFGFIRNAEAESDSHFDKGTKVAVSSYCVVAGNAKDAPSDAKGIVLWAIANNRPFVQQGSTWRALRDRVANSLGVAVQLSSLEPHVSCETHPQAVAAAETGDAWCIVPQHLARVGSPGTRSGLIDAGASPDTMVLVNYGRALRKHADAELAWNDLNRAIRKIANLATG